MWSELRPDRPQVRERGLEERRLEVLGAGRAPGPRLRADGPLDHLYVTIAPLLDALVEVDHPLANLADRRIVPVDVDQDSLELRRRLDRLRHIALQERLRHRVAAGGEVLE